MATLFFTSLGLIALAVIIMFINIITGLAPRGDVLRRSSRVMFIHFISSTLYIFGILGTVGFGIAWIVQAISK